MPGSAKCFGIKIDLNGFSRPIGRAEVIASHNRREFPHAVKGLGGWECLYIVRCLFGSFVRITPEGYMPHAHWIKLLLRITTCGSALDDKKLAVRDSS